MQIFKQWMRRLILICCLKLNCISCDEMSYKCLLNNSDNNISTRVSLRVTGPTNRDNGLMLNVIKCKTVKLTLQNSFYIRAPRTWNTLPSSLRETNRSISSFKKALRNHYLNLTKDIFNPDDPRSFKSICVKCHQCRPLSSIKDSSCC
jgi:hypothetical protein